MSACLAAPFGVAFIFMIALISIISIGYPDGFGPKPRDLPDAIEHLIKQR